MIQGMLNLKDQAVAIYMHGNPGNIQLMVAVSYNQPKKKNISNQQDTVIRHFYI